MEIIGFEKMNKPKLNNKPTNQNPNTILFTNFF
jgi:hypothetical protein